MVKRKSQRKAQRRRTKTPQKPSPRFSRRENEVDLHAVDFPIHAPTNPFVVFVVSVVVLLAWLWDSPSVVVYSALGVAGLHLYCRIALGGWRRKLPVPEDDEIFVPLDAVPRNVGDLTSDDSLRVVVTGGGGFLGWTIVKHLRSDPRIEVVALDLSQPHPIRVVEGVRCVVANLATDDLRDAFRGCHAVIHTAGVVDLTIDVAATHNAHVVGTARVIQAARESGARFLVQTSSVGSVSSPFVTARPQTNLEADFVPPEIDRATGLGFPFFSSYSSTKFRSERMALAANAPELGFRTLAVLLPMIYGNQDPMIVRPLFRGERDTVPDGRGALVEFVYVENAAAMHVRCLHALLEEEERDVGGDVGGSPQATVNGRAFNVTNGDAPREATTIWNELVDKINAKQFQPVAPKMKTVPYFIMYSVACVTEAIFALTCGHVPARRNPVWNLTRSSLSLSCTTVTQDMEDTRNVLGFTPKFNTMESFDDMVADEHRARGAVRTPLVAAATTTTNPLDSISWAPPKGVSFEDVDLFGRMSGPGMQWKEVLVTSLGTVFGMMYAYSQRRPEWTNTQLGMSLSFALINASAIVQCSTPTSKRWYHMGGRLSNFLAYVITVEVAVLVIVLHATFGDGGKGGLNAAFGRNALVEAFGLASAVLVTHFSPLSIQRGVGVSMMCGGFALLQANDSLCAAEANCPGMEWCIPLLLLKYCISHVPRHEPYV